MTPNDFCFWLNGYLEMSGSESIDKVQTNILKDHLKLVFEKKTPYYTYGGGINLTSISYDPAKGIDQSFIPSTC
jgi:hypothetical protein